MSTTLELAFQELQNRIGQITSQYETNIAILKAQATETISGKDAQIEALNSELESLKNQKEEKKDK
jgi:uncharacterized small protein (DUF1192 family)